MIYDVIVIGGGPAGYLAAERAAQNELSAIVFEKRSLGGVCLNEGCIPTKTLLYSAKLADSVKAGGKYGVSAENVSINHEKVLSRKKKVVNMLVGGIAQALNSVNTKVVMGEAVIRRKDDEGFVVEVNNETYKGRNLIIASGSVPVVIPIPGLDEAMDSGFAITSREALDLLEIPDTLAVIGGGVIGLEIASYFNSCGSKVTIIEMLPKIAGAMDGDISSILMKNYEKKGITFCLGAKVTKVQQDGLVYEADGTEYFVSAQKILISIGRRANTAGIGLENIGVKLFREAVIVDDHCRTNVPGVYAAGDVNGFSMLAHTAYREAEVAVNNIAGKEDIMSYRAIPSIIYTNPEVASVGETEKTAKEKGLNIDIVKISNAYSGRYVAENEGGNGITKLIIDKDKQTIVGIHMIGNYSSELIVAGAIFIETKMELKDIKKIVFPHPTVCELIREAVFHYQ